MSEETTKCQQEHDHVCSATLQKYGRQNDKQVTFIICGRTIVMNRRIVQVMAYTTIVAASSLSALIVSYVQHSRGMEAAILLIVVLAFTTIPYTVRTNRKLKSSQTAKTPDQQQVPITTLRSTSDSVESWRALFHQSQTIQWLRNRLPIQHLHMPKGGGYKHKEVIKDKQEHDHASITINGRTSRIIALASIAAVFTIVAVIAGVIIFTVLYFAGIEAASIFIPLFVIVLACITISYTIRANRN